ncbi:general secretion pathway protein K [Geobacter sp. OR-1]|uniref:general secretion pathway protein GspK n=1 Tax=Geobacter sp. OR-1 TaxID=1266765 RepID=UPI0005420AA8|nr:type II secretion system protein GspK [Geobacter sp. OR-1]GAM08226.1 general secretion pathway protein K [Geobacter sp. OR-1]
MSRSNHQEGSVLIIVLVLMMVAVSLALYAVSVSREILSTSQQLMDKLQARLESGSQLEKLKYIGSTGRFTSWNLENLSGQKELPLLLSLRGDPIMASNSEIRLQDSAGRLGIWPPISTYLQRMLRSGGLGAPDVAIAVDSLLDWGDEDDLKRLNGAEVYYYRSESSKTYQSRNNRFIQTIGELELVKGWRGPVYNLVRNEMLETAGGRINLNTADATLIASVLNIDLDIAKRLVMLRGKTGVLTHADLLAASANTLTFDDEYITNFPSLTVAIDIRTRISAAGDAVKALIRFKPGQDRPYTVEKYDE